MGDDLTEFAKWLREAAAHAGYAGRGSTAELARAADLDPGQMSRFLNGKAVPSSANLPSLADALHVSIDEMARRIAGIDIRIVRGPGITPQEAMAALGITDPRDTALVLALLERLKAGPGK